MLAWRVVVGAALIAALLGVLWLDRGLTPWYPLWLLASLFGGAIAAWEAARMIRTAGAPPSLAGAIGGTLAVVVANWSAPLLAGQGSVPAPEMGLAWPMWAFLGVLMIMFISQGIQFRNQGGATVTLAGTLLAVAYVGLLGSALVQHRWLPGGTVPVLMLITVAKGSDTGAYTVGRLFGRRKLWPRLSPNKTVEGALGGLAFGVIAAVAIAWSGQALGGPEFRWGRTLGYGLLVGTAAQLGDLMESMIKRDCAAKDASQTLPGFGGLLDVLDSMLFAAPVSLAAWLLLWT